MTAGIVGVIGAAQLLRPSEQRTVDAGASPFCRALVDDGVMADYGTIDNVEVAAASNVHAAIAWQEARLRSQGVQAEAPLRGKPEAIGLNRALADSERLYVCVFHGEFRTPTGPPNPDGSAKPPHNLLRVLVTEDRQVVVDSAGYRGTMDVTTP
ncbi:MAG: hypothetical protein U0Q19_22335 [Kineosporiaceae bacterium]